MHSNINVCSIHLSTPEAGCDDRGQRLRGRRPSPAPLLHTVQQAGSLDSYIAACLLSHCWQALPSWMYCSTSHNMVRFLRSSSRIRFTRSYTLAPESGYIDKGKRRRHGKVKKKRMLKCVVSNVVQGHNYVKEMFKSFIYYITLRVADIASK